MNAFIITIPKRHRILLFQCKDTAQNEWRGELISQEETDSSWFDDGAMQSNDEDIIVLKDWTYRGNLKIQNILNESKISQDKASKNKAAQEAHDILWKLEQLQRADTVTYNLVLNALAKSTLQDSAQQAQKILQRMEHVYQTQLHSVEHPDGETDGIITVKPNVRTYSTVIDALTKSPGMEPTDAAQASQELLERLGYLYEATGDIDFQPNTIMYNSVMNSWAKTGTMTGALNAMKLLEYMEEPDTPCEPDVITYNTCIHAWAKCKTKESGEQAELLLRRMEHRRSMTCKPNIRTYSSCIDAWCSSNSPSAARRAHSLLDELEAIYEETSDVNMQPNAFTYSSVINAHAKSKQSEKKAVSALQVLKRMKEMYESGKNPQAKPTIVSYNSVLNACATTFGRSIGTREEERTTDTSVVTNQSQHLALGIVRVIYRELTHDNSEITPDHFTYGTVLKACANLMTPLDDEALLFIRDVFEKCCSDGQVSFGVLFQLRQAAPIELYRDLIPIEAIDATNDHFILEKIPSSWNRNVKERCNISRNGEKNKNK